MGCLGPRNITPMPSHWQDLELGADLPSSLKKGTQPTSYCGECMCEAFKELGAYSRHYISAPGFTLQ